MGFAVQLCATQASVGLQAFTIEDSMLWRHQKSIILPMGLHFSFADVEWHPDLC